METERTLLVTVDVENWYNSKLFDVQRALASKAAECYSSPAEDLDVVLESFEAQGLKATFFVLGSLLEEYYAMPNAIDRRGHEVGMHAYNHGEFRSEEEFVHDLKRGVELFIRKHGSVPKGYRHPYFMINRRKLEILSDTFGYDASLVPSIHIPGHYGQPFSSPTPKKVGRLVELPLSVAPYLRLPAATGWYYRNLGETYVATMLKWSLKRHGYAQICLHTWEFTEKGRVEGIPRHVFRNCGKPMEKLVAKIAQIAADQSAKPKTCTQYLGSLRLDGGSNT